MWARIKHAYRYKLWHKKAGKTPFNRLYKQKLPSRHARFSDLRFLVVDCEMSGLDPARHQLLSIGWVAIENSAIVYYGRKHLLVHADSGVGDSIKIHGLSEKNIAGAASATRALTLLAEQAENSILVFHHAGIDITFLQSTALATFGCPMLFPYIDTMTIEQRRLNRQDKTGGLQLDLCRQRYGLPPATQQHNALSDAIATAELLLAQAAGIADKSAITIGDIQPINVS
jgi:DNA polymerase-3 subunit epsilon